VIHKAIVIGGGNRRDDIRPEDCRPGYEVYLLEKEDKLGGNLWNIHYTLDGQDVGALLETTINRVKNHPLIHVLMNAKVVDSSGSKGNFTSGVKVGPNGDYQKIQHALWCWRPAPTNTSPTSSLWGRPEDCHPARIGKQDCQRVCRHCQSEKDRNDPVRGIQKQGTADCSRTCCATAVKNALKLRTESRRGNHGLYRDVRTYGLSEPYYAKARSRASCSPL